MTLPPGSGHDLDALVDDAIAVGDPDRILEEDRYSHGIPLVGIVSIQRRLDLAKALFSAGATMSTDDLADVIGWGVGPETVKFLLDQGVPHNTSCLDRAIWSEKWEVVFTLLDRGLDIHTTVRKSVYNAISTDIVETTLLHVAAWVGADNAVCQLLSRGLFVDDRDSEGMTPLMKSCHFRTEYSKVSPNTVYWLLQHGADPNAKTPEGETPLLLCIGERPKHVWSRTNVAQMLLRHGADPNVVSPAGTTPLMLAARDNDEILARALLRAGARTDILTPDGRTIRDVARKWKSKSVEALLS